MRQDGAAEFISTSLSYCCSPYKVSLAVKYKTIHLIFPYYFIFTVYQQPITMLTILYLPQQFAIGINYCAIRFVYCIGKTVCELYFFTHILMI